MSLRCRSLALVFLACGLGGCSHERIPSAVAATSLASLTVPGGTEFHVTLAAPIGSKSAVGDSVSGTMASAIVVGDKVAVPAGSRIQGHVASIDRARDSVDLSFTEVTTPVGNTISMSGWLAAVGTRVILPAGADIMITLDQPLTIAQRS
ncbi:MAG TPA: hypothetical protein VJ826_15855 [Candidatus Polarisedimenticolaceae bacterium]|nr:hypothetical protein [Candidatus Polarisedimenticolaceae bacterium]